MKSKTLRVILILVALEVFVTVAFLSWDLFQGSSAVGALLRMGG